MRAFRRVAGPVLVLLVSFTNGGVARAEETNLATTWESPAPTDPVHLAADERGAVATGRGGEVFLFDTVGAAVWTVRLANAQSIRSVSIGGDLVIVGVDGGFVALTRAAGDIQWEHALADPRVATIGTISGEPAVALLDDFGMFEIVDGRTGAMRWSNRVAIDGRMVRARAWLIDDLVVHWWADRGGSHLRAHSGAGGQPLWQYDAPMTTTEPAVVDGTVTFAENVSVNEARTRVIQRFVRLDVHDGVEQWTRTTKSRVPYAPMISTAVGADAIAFVNLMGRVVAVEPERGQTLWTWNTRAPQLAGNPQVIGDVFAMTTYGTGVVAAAVADGRPVDVEGVEPGQTAMTIQASAAAGNHLFLLVDWTWGDPEIWMLEPDIA